MNNGLASPAWQVLDDAAAAGLPAALRPWITLSTSMTARLRASVQSEVGVELLRHEPGTLHEDERGCFEGAAAQGQVREVCLHGAGRSLLAARTVHVSARLAQEPGFAGLGTRPLGELLFGDGMQARWSLREFSRLAAPSPLWPLVQRCAAGPRPPCWARRSVFWLQGEPLLVTEIFLPPVPDFMPT